MINVTTPNPERVGLLPIGYGRPVAPGRECSTLRFRPGLSQARNKGSDRPAQTEA